MKTIKVIVKGAQEHINSRNRVEEFPFGAERLALEYLRERLEGFGFNETMPTELEDVMVFDCGDYLVKVEIENQLFIVEYRQPNGDNMAEVFEEKQLADEAFENFISEAKMEVYSWDSINGKSVEVISYVYTGEAKEDPMEMIEISVQDRKFYISDNFGSLYIFDSENDLNEKYEYETGSN